MDTDEVNPFWTPEEERPYPCNTYGPDHICGDCSRAGGHWEPGQQYPYFDTGLGMEIKGPRHKSRVLNERGLVEVGTEFDKYVRGKWVDDTKREVCSKQEVTEKLAEIRHRFENDPSYRRKYGGE
ncbi:MAG: hypothetical protein OEV86_15930 [Candidatus Krumholzibacteria bacterium]|nr:hypothetical protein [Candidatus Krumholzibacteria bacterium]